MLTRRRAGRPAKDQASTPSSLGRRIREARQAQGLSLAAVAGKDFSRAFLNQVELGRAQPSTQTLRIIAHRLQQPIEYFLEDPGDSSAALELAVTEAGMELHRGQADHAAAIITNVLQRPLSIELRTQAQLVLAGARLKQGRADDARPILEEAIGVAERSGWHPLLVELYDRMGSVYYLLRRANAAGQWFEKALAEYESAGLEDPTLKARVLGHRANLHFVAGEPVEAIAAYEHAITAAERVLDMTALAGIYEGLALSLQQTGQFARALNYAQKGLRIFETVRDVRMAAQLRHNMADMLLQQGRAEEAERLFAEGADHLRRIADAELLPHLVSGMAESALERDDIPRAAVLIDEAVDLASRSTDPLAAAHAHRVAGRVFHRRGAKHQGRRHFERALEIARTVESPDLLGRITYDFARALEEEGDTVGAALRYREAYEAGRVATRQSLPLSQDLA